MKKPDTSEIDRILRRSVGRGGEGVQGVEPNGDSATHSRYAHLDADELNAFAEGSLTETARSRYFAHLADCDSCRKLATELTLYAAAERERESRVVAAVESRPGSWRDRLAAIFAPAVLRYAVPMVGLSLVIVIAIVALRGQRDGSSVARNEQPSQGDSLGASANSNSYDEKSIGTIADTRQNNTSAAPGQQTDTTIVPSPQATPAPDKPVLNEATQPPVAGLPVDSAPVPGTATTGGAKQGPFAVEEKDAQEIAAASTAKPEKQKTTAESVGRRRDERQTESKAGDDLAVDGVAAENQNKVEDQDKAGRASTTRAQRKVPAASPPAPAAKRGAPKEDSEPNFSAGLFNVGGRRFRKQDGAWVDTAYNSSRPTTNVARGSEQYRALVADEPGLRTITQQLDGEVIVVWKTRAYRFY